MLPEAEAPEIVVMPKDTATQHLQEEKHTES